MSPFDYAVGLVSILVSLALADVASSLRRLVRQGRAVTWDGRVILSVAFVILLVVGMWFQIWSIRNIKEVLSFPSYLWLFLEFIVLFLVCAACLPDEAVEGCDLAAFYERNRIYQWSLLALFQMSFVLHTIYFNRLAGTSSGRMLVVAAAVALPLAIFVLLAIIRSRLAHYIALFGLLAYYLWAFSGLRLAP
jgi:hypothetical protein